jgi:hypothetical protein
VRRQPVRERIPEKMNHIGRTRAYLKCAGVGTNGIFKCARVGTNGIFKCKPLSQTEQRTSGFVSHREFPTQPQVPGGERYHAGG